MNKGFDENEIHYDVKAMFKGQKPINMKNVTLDEFEIAYGNMIGTLIYLKVLEVSSYHRSVMIEGECKW